MLQFVHAQKPARSAVWLRQFSLALLLLLPQAIGTGYLDHTISQGGSTRRERDVQPHMCRRVSIPWATGGLRPGLDTLDTRACGHLLGPEAVFVQPAGSAAWPGARTAHSPWQPHLCQGIRSRRRCCCNGGRGRKCFYVGSQAGRSTGRGCTHDRYAPGACLGRGMAYMYLLTISREQGPCSIASLLQRWLLCGGRHRASSQSSIHLDMVSHIARVQYTAAAVLMLIGTSGQRRHHATHTRRFTATISVS